MSNFFRLNLDLHGRVFGLDLLRALAIFFVVLSHGAHLLPEPVAEFSRFFVQDGVSMFFVLSGFLIGGILIRIVEKSPKKWSFALLLNFWTRRWLRTLPAYLFVLGILVCAHLLFKPEFSVVGVLPYIFFLQNFSTPHPSFFGEAWSLSVEEWFYCLLPILTMFFVSFCNMPPKKSFLFTIILFIAVVTLFRYDRFFSSTLITQNDWDLLFRKQVVTRLDSLMYGVLGAFLACYYPSKWMQHKRGKLIAGLLLLVFDRYIAQKFFLKTGLYASVFSFSVVSLSVLLVLPFLSSWKTYSGIFYKPVMYISLSSYSMYLLNLTVIQGLIINRIPFEYYIHSSLLLGFARYGLYWALVICFSVLMYKYIELPVLKWRDKTQL